MSKLIYVDGEEEEEQLEDIVSNISSYRINIIILCLRSDPTGRKSPVLANPSKMWDRAQGIIIRSIGRPSPGGGLGMRGRMCLYHQSTMRRDSLLSPATPPTLPGSSP